MSIFAKIENGIVENIIICDDSNIGTQSGFYVKVTNYTNEAGPGYEYNMNKNKFIAPQPFNSWTLNQETCLWEAPVEKPSNATLWNEQEQSWIIPE